MNPHARPMAEHLRARRIRCAAERIAELAVILLIVAVIIAGMSLTEPI